MPETQVRSHLSVNFTFGSRAHSLDAGQGSAATIPPCPVGAASDALHDLSDEPQFDAVFLDADKANYPGYLEQCTPLIRTGGLLIADNVFWEGKIVDPSADDPDTVGMREFNRLLADDARYDTCRNNSTF